MRQRLQFVADYNSAESVFTKEWQPTVDSLADYFRSHGTANERMTAYYLKGRVHHDLGKAPQALDAYQRATEQADTTRDDCDLRTLTAIYGQMANLFEAQYLPDNEMKALQMAERIAWKDKDTLAALVAFDLRSRPYYLKDEKDSVLFVEKQARERYLKYGYKEEAAQAMLGTISILLDREQIQEAKHYLDIFEQESGWFDSDGNILEGKELCYYDKGRYLLAVGQTDSALLYFQKTLQGGWKESGNKGLLSVYEKKNNSDSIAKYAKLFAAANDSNFLHVNQEKVHQITAMYDYSHYQRVAVQKEQEAENWKSRMNIVLIVTLALLASFISFVAYFYRSKTKILEKINALTNKKIELETMLLEKEQFTEEHRQEIIRLNNKNSRIHRTQKEETAKLLLQIEALQKKLLEKDSAPSSINSKNEEIIHHFIEKFAAYHKGYMPPTENEWSQLEKAFAQEYDAYSHLITSHRSMKKEQIRICMMLRLGFTESMMALALEADNKYIDRKKRQINNKLFQDDKSSTLKGNLQLYS
ncbi:MAG: hypothetical protein SPL55_04150 [Prevotella sp.]|nr:hypothetical protein [Prevotella sp.]